MKKQITLKYCGMSQLQYDAMTDRLRAIIEQCKAQFSDYRDANPLPRTKEQSKEYRRLRNATTTAVQDLYRHLYCRYVIRYQWRRDTPIGPHNDWRSWRHFAAIPILFMTEACANEYMQKVGHFKNLRDLGYRKISCSVNLIRLPGSTKDVLASEAPDKFYPAHFN